MDIRLVNGGILERFPRQGLLEHLELGEVVLAVHVLTVLIVDNERRVSLLKKTIKIIIQTGNVSRVNDAVGGRFIFILVGRFPDTVDVQLPVGIDFAVEGIGIVTPIPIVRPALIDENRPVALAVLKKKKKEAVLLSANVSCHNSPRLV